MRHRCDAIGPYLRRVIIDGRSHPGPPSSAHWVLRMTRETLRHLAATGLGPDDSAPNEEPYRMAAAARQDERRRLRRDLHDSLAPCLAALHMRLEVAGLTIGADADRALTLFEQTRQDISAAIADIREIIRDLSAPQRTEEKSRQNFRHSLTNQVRAFDSATGGRLRLSMEIPDDVDRLPTGIQFELQNIAGEALANVVRHSRATVCHISVQLSGDGIHLLVEDNGVGISRTAAAGIGLPSMCIRSRELGGEFSVERNHPRGTVIRVRLPLTADRDAAARPASAPP